jgi:peptidoglycan/LPS O-acetylase OafA/YrhL
MQVVALTADSPPKADLSAPAVQHPLAYRRDIDGLRAVAVLSVVAFHAAPGRLPGGFVGVDVFFVISGFLISGIIMSQLGAGRFSFADFYARRILRIFPPLLAVLLCLLVTGTLFFTNDEFRSLGKHVAAGAGFVSNLTLWGESGYFDVAADFKPLLHLWSLGIEEQFYLAWPLLLYLCWRRGGSFGLLTAAIAIPCFLFGVYLVTGHPVAAFYSPLTRFWELLAGCGAALLAGRNFDPRLRNLASVAGVAMLIAALMFIDRHKAFPGLWALLPTMGAVLIIAAGPSAKCNAWVLGNPLMVGIGLISYALYLWHWPLLAFPRILNGAEVPQWLRAASVGLALVLSVLSYRFLERPIRASAERGKTALILLVLMFAVGLLGAAIFLSNISQWRPIQPSVANEGQIGPYDFFNSIRQSSVPCAPEDIRAKSDSWEGIVRCFQSRPGDNQDIAIVGDSHGESLFPGLAEVFRSQNIVFYGMDGLPFLSDPEYSAIYRHVLDTPSIKTVFVAAAWDRKLSAAPASAWRKDLKDTVDQLAAAGKQVYLVDDIHAFGFAPNRCKYLDRLWLPNKCGERVTPQEYLSDFRAVAASNPAVRVVSPNGPFCSDTECFMARNGHLLYRDEHHLTIAGSRLAAGAIAEQLAR